MSPEPPPDADIQDVEENPTGTKKPGSKAQGRKRTKTGCLTCRKRRIKCGEERPTCSNCTKSKRHCEGYNQRVVFKDPLSASHGPFAQVTFSSGRPAKQKGEASKPSTTVPGPLPNIAPKPNSTPGAPSAETSRPKLPTQSNQGFQQNFHVFQGDSAPSSISPHGRSPEVTEGLPVGNDTVDRSYLPNPDNSAFPRETATHYDFNALFKQPSPSNYHPQVTQPPVSMEWMTNQNTQPYPQDHFRDPNRQFPTPSTPPVATPITAPHWQNHIFSMPPSVGSSMAHVPNITQAPHYNPPQTYPQPQAYPPPQAHPPPQAYSPPQAYPPPQARPPPQAHPPLQAYPAHREQNPPSTFQVPVSYNATHTKPDLNTINHPRPDLNQQVFRISDDEISMGDYGGDENEQGGDTSYDMEDSIAAVMELQARQNAQGKSLRSFTSFIDRADMLSTYNPSFRSSPLNDNMTARIFCHFVHVTGPSMSMFERNPANPSLMFQGKSIPQSQQHIWTYTFPMLALKNDALLHAILAIASLHIAKLQKTHVTASLKHYAIALRRVTKLISIPGRREHPVVLATTMLLCFYECWCADHQKWSGHLLGVRSLVRDIDFAGMTMHMKAMRTQLRNEERDRYREEQMRSGATFFEDRRRLPAFIEEIDENIVGVLMGTKLRYDEYGRIIDDVAEKVESRIYSPSDVDTYELQRDLIWWYYKNDYIQSILGGGKLFLEYDRWSLCPPRAPLGRLDAVYGTFDHLVLLIGRVADFSARDQKRKRLAMKANSTGGPTPPMPHFAGMIPNLKEPKPPMGYSPAHTTSSESSEHDTKDLETQKLEAEDEWQEIRNAFSVLEDHFGEDFQPLGEEFSTPISTPFGTALQYRTYGVAGVWLNYYMGLIACHRAHPSMPPAAMAAAGIAARKTAYFANEIGRIAAGITGDLSMTTQVNPGVGAALIESSTCLFIAGVQYQKSDQRTWTVKRLKDIARLTGWESALAIAAGCETSWSKAAEFGKGPPYHKVEEPVVPQILNSVRSLQRDYLSPFYRGEREKKDQKLVLQTPERIHYALGVLAFQEDFDNLELVDSVREEPRQVG